MDADARTADEIQVSSETHLGQQNHSAEPCTRLQRDMRFMRFSERHAQTDLRLDDSLLTAWKVSFAMASSEARSLM